MTGASTDSNKGPQTYTTVLQKQEDGSFVAVAKGDSYRGLEGRGRDEIEAARALRQKIQLFIDKGFRQ